jgi:hypothetical protein
MSHYQDIVRDFLHAKKSIFVSPELKIQLVHNKDDKGTYWYCDIVAIDMKANTVFLCEVTYSKTLQALIKRLKAWDNNWLPLREALIRDCGIPKDWNVEPWVFIPKSRHEKLRNLDGFINIPTPRVTYLESIPPWLYEEDNRTSDMLEK